MKRSFYIIIVFIALGFLSCRKASDNFTIKQFDQQSIQNYISQNGLTGMVRDTTGGDTTGIYYQILNQGTASVVDYPTKVSIVYAYHTFDGDYATTDTIVNHTNDYLGHISPNAVQISIRNILKRKGGRIRLLIPSRLAFGINGYYSGTTTINGNQCLDYTVELVNNDPILPVKYNALTNQPVSYQTVYDDQSIQKYLAANSLTGYQAVTSASGYKYYYKVITVGTGLDPISLASTVGVQYTGYLFNGTAFDTEVTTDGTAATSFTLYDVVDGFSDALTRTRAGAQISFILPSILGYGDSASGTIPAFSCLRFDMTVVSVTN